MKRLLFVLLIVTLASCGKKVTKFYPEMVGLWSTSSGGKNYTITIGSDNSGKYSECSGALSCTETSGQAHYKDGSLSVGPFKKLKVDKLPSQVGAYWYMTVEGLVYMKQ